MEIITQKPLRRGILREVQEFLQTLDLKFDSNCGTTTCIYENGQLVATGSRDGAVLKCIGVSGSAQGGGYAALLLTALLQDAAAEGQYHLFLYTKPVYETLFTSLGFFPVVQTDHAVLLENKPDGAAQYAAKLRQPQAGGRIGCIVANCNPFTNGHLYLAQEACKVCDFVYFLLLSENKSMFPAEVRLRLARKGLENIPNIAVCPTGPYLVSAATFPDYFIKDHITAQQAYYDVDIAVFLQYFVPALHITTRFAGCEPDCSVTNGYNARMAQLLPQAGVRLREIPRLESNGMAVSAGTVRNYMAENNLSAIRPLVPPATLAEIERMM